MSAGARIVFVRFQSPESPKLAPWSAHADRVIGRSVVAPADDLPGGTIVWHLVSANNRELARGARVLDSFGDARADAQAVVDAADRLEVSMVSETGRGQYGWFAALDGEPVATCARWYASDRDRRHSVRLALLQLAGARLHDGARLTDPALMAGTGGRLD